MTASRTNHAPQGVTELDYNPQNYNQALFFSLQIKYKVDLIHPSLVVMKTKLNANDY